MDLCSLEAKPLLTLAEALENIKASIRPVNQSETVALPHALGRVLAEPVHAPINLPYQRNAAMDGYALIGEAIQEHAFTLKLAGTSWAGRPFPNVLKQHECVRIFTGAVVPEQADTVIMQEQTQADGDNIHFPGKLKTGQNVRNAGEDVRVGDVLCTQGKKLTALDLSLLAAAGVADVTVTRPLQIVFFSTGDELAPLGQPLATGKIYDSNRYLLDGLLVDACYTAVDGGILADDPKLLEETLSEAGKHYDAIITTGGASVGDADYIKDVLARCGQINFWKIAIKPGKPLAFGMIGNCYFFGLPGNPAAVLTTFEQLVAPALRQLSGARHRQPLRIKAVCTNALKKSPGRQEFQRGTLTQDDNGDFFVSAPAKQGSHILSTLSSANCFIVLPAQCTGIAVGDTVVVEPFDLWL